ncbi:MAG: pantetheine-phosphate adenylyltransferase [Treponemataceae bacterium]|nr:MAG: pantetheine-phosphate adenylyltransferase [Treponemataceae bacterium]
MASVIFPGSFDPPTYGHLNVIERARVFFDEIHVVIAVNRSKNCLFSAEERLAMMCELASRWDNVTVAVHEQLIVNYARDHNIHLLLRGVRNVDDFTHEFDISLMNKALDVDIETILLPTESRFFVLKSSAIKELAFFGGDISAMVPPAVDKALKEKFGYQ